MTNLSSAIPGISQGVSQQPEAVRVPNKLEESVNFYPDVVDGLIKRHPTRWIAEAMGSGFSNVVAHTIDRGPGERYVLILTGGLPKVFDLSDGSEVHVEATASVNYMNCTTPRESLRAVTIQDYTIISNIEQTPALSGTLTAAKNANDLAFIFVRQGNYEMDYIVSFNISATTYTYTCGTFDGTGTPGSAGSGASIDIKTHAIAEDLAAQINAQTGTHGVVASQSGSVIKLTRNSAGTIDELEVKDTVGETSMILYHNELEFGTELTPICEGGFKIKVTGDPGTDADDYWIEFQANSGASFFGEGQWVESSGYSEAFQYTTTTMPHQLVRKTDDGAGTVTGTANATYFDFETISWANKEVGDSVSNVSPSFIGEPIRDVFFFRNRLGFLAGDNVVLSGVGDYFNFWRNTVQDVLDGDRIDVGVQHTRVSQLNWAVPYNQVLMLFSDRTQFVLDGNPTLTPRTITVSPALEFENELYLKPIANGRTVFFGYKQGDFSQVREAYRLPDGESFDAAQVTAEVPKYIEGTLQYMASSTRADMLVGLTDETEGTIYVYKYYWDGNQKVQSAWQKYKFGGASTKVIWADFIEENLYLLVQRDTSTGSVLDLESMTISSGRTDTQSTFFTALDRRLVYGDLVSSVATYDAYRNETTLFLPWEREDDGTVEVWTASEPFGGTAGSRVKVIDGAVTVRDRVVVEGDLRNTSLYIGQTYDAYFEVTRPLLKQQTQTGYAPFRTGRTQIKQALVSYENTAHFKVRVLKRDGATRDTEFNGHWLSIPSFTSDEVSLTNGVKRVPVRSKVDRVRIQVWNETPLPSNIAGVELEMSQNSQSQRV